MEERAELVGVVVVINHWSGSRSLRYGTVQATAGCSRSHQLIRTME